MIPLEVALADYLRIRRALGYKLEREAGLLPGFIDFLGASGAVTVSTELAVAWARLPVRAHPVWWGQRLALVRGFARYLQTLDPATEVPPADVLPVHARRATPFLYSETEVSSLIKAANRLRAPLMASTYATVIGLLAVTGMRVGEVIRLDRPDVDLTDGFLTVRNSKFGKSREIPLHATTTEALQRHAELRRRWIPRSGMASFFVSTAGTRLFYSNVQDVFSRLTRSAGLHPRSASCRPRLHDLRHSFAVNTLLGWYRDGVDVQQRLPLLSTYLGHVDPNSTYWYLSASPELFAIAAERLDSALGVLP